MFDVTQLLKAIAFKHTDKTLFTEFHALVGTPRLPLSSSDRAEHCGHDTRADSYSLGVLLHELLVLASVGAL